MLPLLSPSIQSLHIKTEGRLFLDIELFVQKRLGPKVDPRPGIHCVHADDRIILLAASHCTEGDSQQLSVLRIEDKLSLLIPSQPDHITLSKWFTVFWRPSDVARCR